MKTIVVGVNGSEEAARALRWSARLAEQNGGRIVAVRAVSRVGIWELAAFQVNPDPVVRGYEEQLRGRWTAPLRRLGVGYTTRLERGEPADALARVATAEDADLLVIGARHRDPAHGSTTRRLLKQTPCPLVVIPNRE
jgi:nucleotide-binding universal stress UspA family protein